MAVLGKHSLSGNTHPLKGHTPQGAPGGRSCEAWPVARGCLPGGRRSCPWTAAQARVLLKTGPGSQIPKPCHCVL